MKSPRIRSLQRPPSSIRRQPPPMKKPRTVSWPQGYHVNFSVPNGMAQSSARRRRERSVSVSSSGLECAVGMGCMTHAATVLLDRRRTELKINKQAAICSAHRRRWAWATDAMSWWARRVGWRRGLPKGIGVLPPRHLLGLVWFTLFYSMKESSIHEVVNEVNL